MPVASAAQMIPMAVMPQSGIAPGAAIPTIPGSTAAANSVFGSLLNSYSQMLQPAEQDTATAGNSLGVGIASTLKPPMDIPAQGFPFAPRTVTVKTGHQESDTKPETGKEPAKADSPNLAQTASAAVPQSAAPPVSAAGNASSLPAPSLDSQSGQAAVQDAIGRDRSLPAASSLAFAVRVAPANANATPAQPPKESNSPSSGDDKSEPVPHSVSSPASVPVVNAVQQREPGSSSNKDGQEFTGGEQQPAVMTTQTHAAAGASAPSARPDFDAELKNTTASPRQAHIQVIGSDNQRVDIRLLENGGGLAVSVRSSDTMLTRTLQDHIPELTGRLESEHFHSEAWTPAAGNSSGARDPKGGSSFSGQSDSSGGGQQRQHDGERPKWVQDLEDNQSKATIKETFYVSSE